MKRAKARSAELERCFRGGIEGLADDAGGKLGSRRLRRMMAPALDLQRYLLTGQGVLTGAVRRLDRSREARPVSH